ncbi:MAG: extracellular solute-binding protein [Spirochaetes bacterium]|nr:extracellular solute-binding protein [Spirochaetota bacterium]
MKKAFLAIGFLLLCAALVVGQTQKPVTLKMLYYSPELADQYNDMARVYNTQTGNTLDITVLQADFVTVLRAKLNSGDIPDVFMSSAYADNRTYKDYCYDMTDEDFIKLIEPTALLGVTVNGRVTGYPFLVQSHSFIYNKKVFADAGIKALPKTLREYEAVCQKLQAKGIQPFATGYKEWWVLPQTAWQVLAPIKDSYGGDYATFVEKLNNGSLKFKNIKEMGDVFNLLDLIKKYGGPKPMESDFNDQCSLLATGKVGMIHQGNWAEDTIRKTNPSIEIGYLLGPVGNAAAKAGIMFDSNQTIRIAKDGKNVQAALAWLRWLTTSEYGKAWVPDKIKQLSPIIGAKAATAQLAQATVSLLAAKTPNYSWYYQRFPTGTEQSLGIILQGYCAGQTNRQQALAALDASYTKIANAAAE